MAQLDVISWGIERQAKSVDMFIKEDNDMVSISGHIKNWEEREEKKEEKSTRKLKFIFAQIEHFEQRNKSRQERKELKVLKRIHDDRKIIIELEKNIRTKEEEKARLNKRLMTIFNEQQQTLQSARERQIFLKQMQVLKDLQEEKIHIWEKKKQLNAEIVGGIEEVKALMTHIGRYEELIERLARREVKAEKVEGAAIDTAGTTAEASIDAANDIGLDKSSLNESSK